MIFSDKKDFRIALKTSEDFFSPIAAGVRSCVRKIQPIVKTFHYISKRSTETEILGYTEVIKIVADRVYDDAANNMLFSFAEFTGTDCKSEIFIYDKNDESADFGTFTGRRYPVSIAVTKLAADESGKTDLYGFEADIYINSEGSIETRSILE